MSFLLNPFTAGTASSPATFVTSTIGTNTLVIPGTAQAGDVAIIYAFRGAEGDPKSVSGGSGGSWNPTGIAIHDFYWKVLQSSDIGVTLTPTQNGGGMAIGFSCLVFRNVTSVSLKTQHSEDTSVSSITMTGFTKNTGHKGVVTFGATTAGSATEPSGYTGVSEAGGVTYRTQGAYKLSGYADNATVPWTFGGVGTASGVVAELL